MPGQGVRAAALSRELSVSVRFLRSEGVHNYSPGIAPPPSRCSCSRPPARHGRRWLCRWVSARLPPVCDRLNILSFKHHGAVGRPVIASQDGLDVPLQVRLLGRVEYLERSGGRTEVLSTPGNNMTER